MLALLSEQPLLAALSALLGLGAIFGALLGFAAIRFRVEGNPISEQVNALLPQTQCGQCGQGGRRGSCQTALELERRVESSDFKVPVYTYHVYT